jgi:chloramphenicol-sensitive protein RarD
MSINKHYAAAITAFLIWGFFAIPLRALVAYSSGQILYFRIVFSVIVLAILVAGFRRRELINNVALLKSFGTAKRNGVIALTLVGGALLTVNWLTFIYTVNNINIKTASFSYLICPVLTAALGTVLLKEQLTRLQWIAVFLCSASCVLIGMSSVLELGFSFLTALTYALYLISQRKNQGFDRIIVLGVQVLFALIVLSLLVNSLVTSVPDELYFYEIIAIIAVFFTVLPLFLNLFALNKINSATIGILMYINPIINFSVALLFYGEKMDVFQVLGYFIIFIALILFNYTTLKRTITGA